MKKWNAVAAALLVVLLFSGCGRMTPERLAVKTAAALAKTPMTSQRLELDFETSVGAYGLSLDMEMAMTGDMVMAAESQRAYMDAEVTVNVLGMDIAENMQLYVLTEENQLVTYTHWDTVNLWKRTAAELPSGEAGSFDWLKAKPVEELTLAEETRTIGEHETYVLSCTLSGAEMQKMLGSLNWEGDLSALEVPAVLYIDTETYLPVQMTLDIRGMNEMLRGMMDQVLGKLTALGLEVEFGTVRAACRDIGYEAAEVPGVPQEGLDRTAEP